MIKAAVLILSEPFVEMTVVVPVNDASFEPTNTIGFAAGSNSKLFVKPRGPPVTSKWSITSSRRCPCGSG
jgi:hypothetical protein